MSTSTLTTKVKNNGSSLTVLAKQGNKVHVSGPNDVFDHRGSQFCNGSSLLDIIKDDRSASGHE